MTDLPNWVALPISVILGGIVSIIVVIKQQSIIDFYGSKSSKIKGRNREKELSMYIEAKYYYNNKGDFIILTSHIILSRIADMILFISNGILLVLMFVIKDMIPNRVVPLDPIGLTLSRVILIFFLAIFCTQFVWTYNRLTRSKKFIARVGQFKSFRLEMQEKWGGADFD